MVAPAQEQRTGPRDGPPVLHQRAVDELDATPFPLHRGLDLYRLGQHRTQQVDREAGRLEVSVDAGSFDAPTQQTPDDLAAQGRAPRAPRHHARQVGVAVDSEEAPRA